MRPQSFQNLVLRLAAEDPATGQTRTLKDAGDSKHPYGFAVATGGREARFQITVKSVPGEDYEQPETSHPAEGDPAELDGPRADGPEGWLAGLLASSGNRQIAAIEQWSLRENQGDRRNGLTVRCHDGSEVYARLL